MVWLLRGLWLEMCPFIYHDILNMHFLEYSEWNFTWEIGRRECVKEKDFHWWMSLNNVNGMTRGFQYQLVMKTLNYLNQIHFEDLNALLCKSSASTCTIILLNCTFTSFQVYSFCCLQTFLFFLFFYFFILVSYTCNHWISNPWLHSPCHYYGRRKYQLS